MDDAARKVDHPLPLRRIAFSVAIVALAHEEKAGGEAERLAGVGARGVDGPQVVGAGPARAVDTVVVADTAAEVVLVDDLAHVLQDLGRGGDGCAGPGLEAVAEGVEITIGADAREAVGDPGASEARLRLEDDEAGARTLLCQVVGAADAGDAGADDQHVEVLGLPACRHGARVAGVHELVALGRWISVPERSGLDLTHALAGVVDTAPLIDRFLRSP